MSEDQSSDTQNNPSLSNTIIVPSYLPKMLTEWSKAVIRTQPSDILRWCVMYFRMKSKRLHPPIKPYLDPPDLVLGPGGLTPNTLKALAMSLINEFEPKLKIESMWDILSLDKTIYLEIIQIGNFNDLIKPKEFIGIAAAYLNNRLRDTMILLCDTLRTNNPNNCISLDTFVTVYQFLARLNCADAESQKHPISGFDEKGENVEEITLNDNDDSQCLLSSDSQMSCMDNEYSCDSGTKETPPDIINAESAEGIMTWKYDNMDLDSISVMLNRQLIESPMPPVCNDPDFLLSINKLKENAGHDDILSLLSDSSIITDSDQSVISVDSASHHTIIKNENITYIAYEEHGEEVMGGSLSLDDLNYGENDTINQNDCEGTIEDIASEGNIETGNVSKYEEIKTATNVESIENHKSSSVKINKDYIVMLALVTNDNEPDPQSTDDNLTENESNDESDFSLLDKTELDDKIVEHTDTSKINVSTFEENDYLIDGKESSDTESSSDSQDLQYSAENDQTSVASVVLEKSSVQMEVSLTEIDGALITIDKNKLDVDRLKDDISGSGMFEFPDMAEEGEQTNNYAYDENDKYLDFISTSAITLDKSGIDDIETTIHLEETFVRVLPGIGPTVSEKQIQLVVNWVTKCASNQNNCVQEHNLVHFLCPPLDYKSIRIDNELNTICI